MNRSKLLAIAVTAVCANIANFAHGALPASSPFAKESTLPFGYPAFDKIHDADYAPAFEEGMRQHAAEIAVIANNKAAPTFDNTIVAMEKSGKLLNRVSTVFFNLVGCNTDDAMNALDKELAPKLAAHNDAIHLNPKLYARVKALYDKRDKLHLDAESKYLLERYNLDFVRAGANLSDADKAKLKDYNGKIAALQTQFSQNVLKEANASALVVDSRAELAGMSEKAIDAAAALAKKDGLDGKFKVPVVNTTQQAPLAVLTNRATREKLLALSLARGSHGGDYDNRDVVLQLVKLRAERAKLLGYPSHAAYILDDQTAKDTTAVNKLLADFAAPAVRNAKKEAGEIQKVIDREHGGFQATAADWDFYSDKVRQEKYAFDQNQLRPYFEYSNVLLNGVFYAANKEYGLTFKERHDLPVYNPDVRVFDVFDADGKQLAIFLHDPYARANKRGGAWMNAYVTQNGLEGKHPVVANHLNIPKPAAGEPTLLTYDEVRTMFHEFGHAARHVLEREVPALRRHPRATRLRRVPVAGQRDVDGLAGDPVQLRQALPDRRADAIGPAGQGAGL
jgi:peptidyl-dipeptidase Dcp